MKKTAGILILLLFVLLHGQSQALLQPGRIIFYNVENLFDTIDDPETQDQEFLPQAKYAWDTKKYRIKLLHISSAIAAMIDTIQPIAIGLSEVENRRVLEDLIAQPALRHFHLGIVHHDSPDERGIDVALLYNKDLIKEDFDAFLKINFPFDKDDRTRDILYFKGAMTEGAPVYFFVNHWPSRRGGKESTEQKRQYVAKVLKDKIDNIYSGDAAANVIVMGDFNDNPDDSSLVLLSTDNKKSKAPPLVNLMKIHEEHQAFSLKYKDENDVFDQFIVSKNLLDRKNECYIPNSSAQIFGPRFLLFDHPKYGLIPNRTYASGRWVGGYSDHLPVYCDLVFK